MCSYSDISDNEEQLKDDTASTKKQSDFVSVIKNYPVLFDKIQVPAIKAKKEKATEDAISELMNLHGQVYGQAKFSKKISRMKGKVKEKSDRTKTGNKKIVLKHWEKTLLDVMGADDNPTINRVPGAAIVGTSSTVEITNLKGQKRPLEENDFETPDSKKIKVPPRPKPKKPSLENYEDDETRVLSMQDLQRLVLLEQLKLIRQKLKRLEDGF